MGSINITSIKRRQFASSVVGTPGVDDSTALALNSLANSSFRIGRQIERNQEPANQIEAVRVSQDLDTAFRLADKALRDKYEANPDLPLKEYEKEATALDKRMRTDGVGGIKNKRVRQLAGLNQQRSRGQRLNNSAAWFLDEQVIRAKNDLDKTSDELALFAGLLDNLDQFRLLQQTKYKGLFDKSKKGILGTEQATIFEKDAIKNGLTSYVNSQIVSDPEAMKEEFDNVVNQKQIFSKSFNSKEIDAFKTKIANSIEGRNVASRVQARVDISRAIKVVTDKDVPDVADYEALKVRFDNIGQLTGPRKRGLDNIIANIYKARKSNTPNLEDERISIELEKRFDASIDTTDEKTGAVKNLEEAMDENIDLVIDIEDARNEGSITKEDAKEWIIALDSAVEAAISEGASESLAIGLFTDALTFGITKSLINYFTNRKQDPMSLGLKRVDSILNTRVPNITDRKFDSLRSKLRKDLRQQIARDRKNGIDITEESVQGNIDKVFKQGANRYQLPDIADDGNISLLDPFTGRRFNPNTLEMIG